MFKRLLSYTITLILAVPLIASAGIMRVHFIHVGYGDCALIEAGTPEKPNNILIDTGGEKFQKKLFKYLKKRDLLPIRTVILTHSHPDHTRALAYLIKKTPIPEIYWNGHNNPDKDFQKLTREIIKANIPMRILKKGDHLSLGEGIDLTCIHPATLTDDPNNNSLVLMLTFNDTSLLFTGDIDKNTQNEIAQQYSEALSNLNVLKLPHHGDHLGDQFTEHIIDVPLPVLMTGKNKYKLPKVETLKTFGSRLLRSDRCIDIVLESDGTQVSRIPPRRKR